MNLPTILTVARLALAPIFFLIANLPVSLGGQSPGIFIVLVVLFLVIEISDILDGYFARTWNQVTDLGKVLDPFSDVVSRVSYFLTFIVFGIMPPFAFLLILYREIGVVFLRMVLAQRGTSMAARKGGKAKSMLYFISSGLGIFALWFLWFGQSLPLQTQSVIDTSVSWGLPVVFWLAALFALISFADYILAFRFKLLSGKEKE